ncbi:MAG: phenol hydroxylase [Gammaproteobacteria bacterium]
MSIDIKTANIEPLRHTFDHIEARIGKGKPATRYQEGVHDFQMTQNFHYRPTWEPGLDLFDRRRTTIMLDDFDALVDPRQYYYAPYTIQRAKMQEAQDNNFTLVEKRNLFATLAPEARARIEHVIVPLRHVEWGANTVNCYIAAYAYGTPFNSAALMQATDRLGLAQYVTRLALVLGGPELLDRGKREWLEHADWQPLRRLVEDTMVIRDWFEAHVVQNLLMDGALYPLAYAHFDQALGAQGGIGYTLATEFMREWHAEAVRWTDATIKVAVNASEANGARVAGWVEQWEPRVREAVAPLARAAFGESAAQTADTVFAGLAARRTKIGIGR